MAANDDNPARDVPQGNGHGIDQGDPQSNGPSTIAPEPGPTADPSRLLRTVLVGAMTALFAGIVAMLAGLAVYCHPAADDYSYWVYNQQHGFWGFQGFWYNAWSGRFSATALISLYSTISGRLEGYGASILLLFVLLAATTFFLVRTLLRPLAGRAMSACAASGFLSLFLLTMPDIRTGMYWFNAGATYIVGLAAAMALLAWLVRLPHQATIARCIAVAAAAIVAAGFSEILALPMAALFIVGAALGRGRA